jgi:uncharacterized protein
VMTGASGLVGTALVPRLLDAGHQVKALVRRPPTGAGEVQWQIGTPIPQESLQGTDVAIHLAGESLAAGRWTAERKQRILQSRVLGTRSLCESLAALTRPPSLLLSASAIGYYGSRGDEIQTEDSAPGEGFLADVCRQWEEAAGPARDKGIRVVHLRFGMILSRNGGALPRMLLAFRSGVGGKIGSGKQYVSWVTLEDVVSAVLFLMANREAEGPVNVVSPNPVTNYDFTSTLGQVLRRPTLFQMPSFGARVAFGEMADALLLSSIRVIPARLHQWGYSFLYSEIEPALVKAVKGKP